MDGLPLIGCDCRLINDRPVGGARPGDPVPSQEEAIKSLPTEKELHLPEMQKVGDTGDISLLFFLAGANFWAISAILGNFGSFLGYFG